jgi:hypothetical protein
MGGYKLIHILSSQLINKCLHRATADITVEQSAPPILCIWLHLQIQNCPLQTVTSLIHQTLEISYKVGFLN